MLKSIFREYELFLCTDDGWLEARVVAFDGTVKRILENTARSKCTYVRIQWLIVQTRSIGHCVNTLGFIPCIYIVHQIFPQYWHCSLYTVTLCCFYHISRTASLDQF